MPPFVRYQYEVRSVVRVTSDPKHAWQVTWRGSLLCADRIRRPVYRLDNEYWDVYFEDELRSAWNGM
ncbi:hypothetical protein [Hymenobacter fodinae]|uniref:Uncharacterized protein n=1 Tax=Hymenobacter fodinae TaxID=2510796 RepID=A0A4Z0P5X9_9BACT|nr:hypothetical protein [Hymenobacter fodinae]TGE07691.1 hypothetical protein EU556_08025 [Hymenobacter fodinae]